MTAPFLVEHSGERAQRRSEASRKGWVSRKRRALTRAMGCPPTPPAPRADAGFTVAEILARLRAAAEGAK